MYELEVKLLKKTMIRNFDVWTRGEVIKCLKFQIILIGNPNQIHMRTSQALRVLQCVAVCCSVLQCVEVCWSVLQCVAVCCSVLQCVAVCCNDFDEWTRGQVIKCLPSAHSYLIWVAQSYYYHPRNRSIVHGGERDTLSEAAVSLWTTVTYLSHSCHGTVLEQSF